ACGFFAGNPGSKTTRCALTLAVGPSRAHAHSDESSHSHEVVCGAGEGKDPGHFLTAAMMQLAQPTDRLPPAEAFFDEFPFHLTDVESRVSRCTAVDRARRLGLVSVRSHVRRRVAGPDSLDELRRVIALIRAKGAASGARLEHRYQLHGRVPLAFVLRRPHVGRDDQPMPVVHQHTPEMTEERRCSLTL